MVAPIIWNFSTSWPKRVMEFALCLQASLGSFYFQPNDWGVIDEFGVGARI